MWTVKRMLPEGEAIPASQTAEIIPFPSSRIPEPLAPPEVQKSYEELAAELGFMPEELVRAQLLAFLRQNGIGVYDYAEVDAYLKDKKEKAKKEFWLWRPLRDTDVIARFRWGTNSCGHAVENGYYTSKDFACRPYDRLVPRHALEKVIKIQKEFGDRVAFFVSDYADPKPDPFLGVRARSPGDSQEIVNNPSVEMLVFDVWDEPGFGAK